MPKRFKRNWKPTPTPTSNTVYLKHPVGSNEWTRQKKIEIEERRRAKGVANKELRK